MVQQVKRVTLSGGVTAVTFQYCSGKYLVKNFSSNPIFVSFEEKCEATESIKISSGMAQVCVINERGGENGPKSYTVYLRGTGEVEVQQLCI